jgi:hypothetical protein
MTISPDAQSGSSCSGGEVVDGGSVVATDDVVSALVSAVVSGVEVSTTSASFEAPPHPSRPTVAARERTTCVRLFTRAPFHCAVNGDVTGWDFWFHQR